ncbi:pyruvate carboxylase subunit B domain protein, partial [Bacteroides fragilis str. 3397 T10]
MRAYPEDGHFYPESYPKYGYLSLSSDLPLLPAA